MIKWLKRNGKSSTRDLFLQENDDEDETSPHKVKKDEEYGAPTTAHSDTARRRTSSSAV